MALEQELRKEHAAIPAPTFGEHGEPCARCGAPLAHDQRYCLNCGQRRAGARGLERLPSTGSIEPAPTPAPTERWSWRDVPPGVAAAVAATAALLFVIGVLIGSAGDGGKQVAAAPTVIRVTAPAATTAQPAAVTSDWPAGKDGFTVQLQTLAKEGADKAKVDQAKSTATSKGATDVGVLDSDEFADLDPGNYVIYAGVFDTRKEAKKALKGLRKNFPGARVIEVSAGGGISGKGDRNALSGKKKEATVGRDQLKSLQKTSPGQYEKKSRKLPDTTKLPGKAPKKDDKKPGGGEGGAQVIG
jgi:hypothetical protein